MQIKIFLTYLEVILEKTLFTYLLLGAEAPFTELSRRHHFVYLL